MTQQEKDPGVFAPDPASTSTQAATDMQGNPVPARTFGPIATVPPAPVPQASAPAPHSGQDTNALLAQLLAAISAQNANKDAQAPGTPAQAPAPAPTSPEDKRLLTALAGIHTSGRDTTIIKKSTIGGGLYFVKYSYTPATGAKADARALVYDDGTDAHVFGGF